MGVREALGVKELKLAQILTPGGGRWSYKKVFSIPLSVSINRTAVTNYNVAKRAIKNRRLYTYLLS